jgi:uncharacterized circularly permuted ATP-grasp superfamily protein
VVNSSQGGGSKDTWVVGDPAAGAAAEAHTPEDGATALRQSQGAGQTQTQRQSMG